MLQVESKLELFENVVYKRRLLDLEKRKEAWEQEKKNLIERKEKQLHEEKDNIVQRRANLARIIGNEKIAKAKENERVLELKKINELKKDFIEAIHARAEEYTRTDKYADDLAARVAESFKDLPTGEYYFAMVRSDMDKYFDRFRTMAEKEGIVLHGEILDDSRIGGHTISDMERTYSLNYDLHTLIADKRYAIGKLLYRLFREEMDHE
ncbi:MAG: hypothetical protein SOW18_01015 [Peptoniphilus sp.]|nr:hypothetical protein [Peptoniphilus sp.]MDY3118100.1 hypothetical protein [Peptoniphilus sp.]